MDRSLIWKGKTTTNALPFNGQNKFIVNGFKRIVNCCKWFGYPFKWRAENVKRLGKVEKRIEGNVKGLTKKIKQKSENVKRQSIKIKRFDQFIKWIAKKNNVEPSNIFEN